MGGWFERNRLDLALFLFGLALVGPWVHLVTAQVSSRYAFSAALVEQGTIRLDDYDPILGIDRVVIDGHIYSDKAPGQPLLAAPAVALGQGLGAQPATVPRLRENLGVWPATLVSAMLPFAALLVLMRRHARRFVGPGRALAAAMAVGCTTLLLPMGADLYSHVLSGTLSLTAWHLIGGARRWWWQAPIAGAAAGLAVAVEYPLLAVAGVLGLALLWQRRWRDAWWFGVAATPFVVGVGVYHWILLGDPTASPYTTKDGGRLHLLTLPGIDNTIDVIGGARGFVFTPVVLLGILGFAARSQWSTSAQLERVVAGTIVVGMLVLQIGWNDPWTGESPGPRLVTPALPFLVVSVALMIDRTGTRVFALVAALGALSMGLALVTLQLLPPGAGLISGHIENLRDDRFGLGPTLFSMAVGPWGWALHFGLVFGATVGLWRAYRRPQTADRDFEHVSSGDDPERDHRDPQAEH